MLESESSSAPPASATNRSGGAALADRYRQVRHATMELIADLSAEDTVPQSMPEASPAKWHLAHTTWFFEQFVLARDKSYAPFDADWLYLFNSYYQSVGPMHARPQRGLLTRPGLAEVLAYRARIDERMGLLLGREFDSALAALVTLGYSEKDARAKVDRARRSTVPDASTEILVKAVLQM